MKIIVSHDVDHINVIEHYKDLIVPKFLVRNLIELLYGSISFKEFNLRFLDIFKNKWNNVNEIIDFNKKKNVKATFFVGVNNGKGLAYSLQNAEKIINNIISKGFDVGVHGIKFDDIKDVKKEFETFRNISKINSFGIRMHYLRTNENTIKYLKEAGYLYDTSIFQIKEYFKINDFIEFPLHIMDGDVCGNRKFGNRNMEEVKKITVDKINEARNNNVSYLTILFHDRYFSDSFKIWKDWYVWLIEFLNENNYEFISYKEAVKEINRDEN